MPSRTVASVLKDDKHLLAQRILPSAAGNNLDIALRVLLLPAPLEPKRATHSPLAIERFNCRTAQMLP